MKAKKVYYLIQEVLDEIVINQQITKHQYERIINGIENNATLKEDENYNLKAEVDFRDCGNYYRTTLTFTMACTHIILIMNECKKGIYFGKW